MAETHIEEVADGQIIAIGRSPGTQGDIVKKHEGAKQLQGEIKEWLKSNHYMLETGIRLPERNVVIYIPCNEQGKQIKDELIASYPDIESKARIEELKSGPRKRLAMNPGRTPLLFGDGGSATLGTFIRDTTNPNPNPEQLLPPQYALCSYHGNFPIVGRDVFVRIERSEGVYRLGRVVQNIYQASPIIDACLIEIDEAMRAKIEISMYVHTPKPPMYFKMHGDPEYMPFMTPDLSVAKYGYGTGITGGKVVEYSRDLIVDEMLHTDNIVTKHENEGQSFALEGDSGAVVFRPIRITRAVNDEPAGFYPAISLLYMSDTVTKESFSFPLTRCLTMFGHALNKNLELASEGLFQN